MKNCLVSICIFISMMSFAQIADTNAIHTSEEIQKHTSEEAKEHSPKKAALLSLAPGGGQIYNHLAMPKGKKKAFWKVPLIYAGLGTTGYFFFTFQKEQKQLKEEYRFREKNGFPNLEKYASYDDQGVLTKFEEARTNRDLMMFAFIIVYGLNILDAHVEAHFVDFDISKDLSLHLRPSMQDFSTPGISISLKFK